MRITGIEIIPIRLPLIEPFVISYGTFPDVESVLVRIETDAGITGWGEGTPDPHVTGETFGGTVEMLKMLAPALLGLDPRDRTAAMRAVEGRVGSAPTAKAALDIALHDLAGRAAGLPVYALLGGKAKEHLTISRVVSLKSPEEMARDAATHIANGFATVKLKVGVYDDVRGDIRRVAAVREALGEPRRTADLFAGLGTFALALPGRIYAAEAARDAVLALKTAAPALAVEHRDLYRRPLDASELKRFACVVLDPPRAGAVEQVAALAASTVHRIAYVSCNPATFARDAGTLVGGGYSLQWVRPVGQFRWSTHIELAACFTR